MAAVVVGASVSAADVHVQVFAARTADVNSFVFYDSTGTLIVDATRSGEEAAEVARLARTLGNAPKVLFLTHGHPDHFLGVGALRREFPGLRILVATPRVKEDIVRFAQAAEKGHWIDDEPLMRPKSATHPDGFDYENEIQVLSGNSLRLPGGGELEVLSDFPPTEAAHETVLYSKDLNAVFASDLVYNGVHLWLGRGVDAQAVKNWTAALKMLKERFAPLNAKVYPGHGAPGDAGLFDVDQRYISDLMAAVRRFGTIDEAKARMIKAYPDWKNADFILAQSLKNQFEVSRPKTP